MYINIFSIEVYIYNENKRIRPPPKRIVCCKSVYVYKYKDEFVSLIVVVLYI